MLGACQRAHRGTRDDAGGRGDDGEPERDRPSTASALAASGRHVAIARDIAHSVRLCDGEGADGPPGAQTARPTAAPARSAGDWPSFGDGPRHTFFNPTEDVITRTNVSYLQ